MNTIKSYLIRSVIKKKMSFNKPLSEVLVDLENFSKVTKLPQDVDIKKEIIEGVKVESIKPPTLKDSKILVYFHGGAYCIGINNMNRKFVCDFAKLQQRQVLFIDYRLAPENEYPSALVDCIRMYKNLLNEYKASNISFVADSSGCGLTLSTLFKLRDEQIELPASVSFICPVLDWTRSGESHKKVAKKDPYYVDSRFYMEKNYFGNKERQNSEISPLFGTFDNLPQILVHAAEFDVYCSDSLQFFEKANNESKNVELKMYKKLWHNFHMMDTIPEAKSAVLELSSFIDKNFNSN